MVVDCSRQLCVKFLYLVESAPHPTAEIIFAVEKPRVHPSNEEHFKAQQERPCAHDNHLYCEEELQAPVVRPEMCCARTSLGRPKHSTPDPEGRDSCSQDITLHTFYVSGRAAHSCALAIMTIDGPDLLVE